MAQVWMLAQTAANSHRRVVLHVDAAVRTATQDKRKRGKRSCAQVC